MPLCRVLIIVVASFLPFLSYNHTCGAQTPPSRPPEGQPVSSQSNSTDDLAKKIEGLSELVKSQEQHYINIFQILGVAVAIITFVPIVVQFMIWLIERRTRQSQSEAFGRLTDLHKEAHDKMIEAFNASIESARTSNAQATTINNLLAVTERVAATASSAQSRLLDLRIAETKKKCLAIISEAKRQDDVSNRSIVAEQRFRSTVRNLSAVIDGFRQQLALVSMQSADRIPAACHFIHGINLHLLGDAQEAIDSWTAAISAEDADQAMKVDCYYWIGQENNNGGHYGTARETFELGARLATGDFKWELERMSLESSFFLVGARSIDAAFLVSADGEYNALPGTANPAMKARFANTVGNIHFAAAKRSNAPDFTRAAYYFDLANAQRSEDKWTQFGKYQCAAESKALEEGDKKQLREHLLPTIQDYFNNRQEARSRLLAKLSEMYIRYWLTDHNGLNNAYELISSSIFSETSGLPTVYSQERKQNVPRAEFFKELGVVYERMKADLLA